MSYLYVSALLGFNIEDEMDEPLLVGNGNYVTNNRKHFISKIKPEQALSIGSLETNYLFNGNPVIYSVRNTNSIEQSHDHIINFMRDCLAFIHTLWLGGDNSVNVMLGFAISSCGGHVHSNSISYHYWTCKGKKEDLRLKLSELKAITEKYKDDFAGMSVEIEPQHTMQRKEVDRVNVAINFLQQARSARDMGLKIANYCSFFESLLSSTTVELSHQMAERSAFYLEETPDRRLQHYRDSKKAYSIRSKVVHGDTISKGNLADILSIGEHCDNMARNLINKYLNDSSFQDALTSGSQKLDEFFINKIFGV